MDIASLPHLQASLNTISALLLVTGYYFIRKDNRDAHRACMISAVAVSVMFLVSYLIYHYNVGSVKFTGTGFIRPVYFFILITHTVLATLIVPMILVTVYRAASGRFESHKKIARWTLPVWIYVSVTGVVVYLFVYHLYRQAPL